MKLKNLILAVLAGGALLVSCQQEKPVFGISADKDAIEIPQAGGSAQVQVTTAQAWTVKIPTDAQAWLKAEPASGTGNAAITFTAAANEGKDRKTGLKINAGMAGYVSVTVTQPGSQKPGDGKTAETAWSPSEARAWIMANLTDKQVTEEKYYIKGFIHKVQTTFAASGTHGNAVFFMSDDGQASSEDFEAYQVYYLEGKQWKSGQPDVQVGDEVIVYGPITLYGSTPETAGKGAAFIYSHLRNGEAPTPGGGGDDTDYSKAEAKTVAEFIAAADKNTYYKLTGKVSSFNASYCSFDLEDATGKIYVYSVLDSYKTEWSSKIKNGGTITIAGKYDYYSKTEKHEVVEAAILSFEGGSDTPAGETKVVTVAEFNAAPESDSQKYQLTGTIGGSINATYGNFDLTDDTGTVYVYGLTATELPYGTKNDQSYASLNLAAGDKITIIGYRGSYNDKIEVMYAYFVEKVSSGGGGGEEPDYSQAPAKTVAEFLAAADPETYYKLTGEVSNFNANYCSFDLTDESGSVYVYSVLASYKNEWKSKVKNGGTITIAGKYKLYNDKPEVVDAAILAFTPGQGGGDEPGDDDFSSNVTWTLGTNAYEQDANVNGVSGVVVLKLGKGSAGGDATLTIPSGATKLKFYALSWNNADVASLVFKNGGTEVATITPAANSGLAGNPTYNLTVTDSDHFEITLPSGVTSLSVATSGGYRAAMFAVKAE